MKILVIFGTRPEAIKLAPLIHRLKTSFDVKVLSSGQHIELTGQVIDFFKIKPDYNFACMKDKPDLESLYECTLSTMKTVIHQENPDAIIVQGDTITTFSGAFLGFMLKKPILHVEAGLRTFKSFSPFPEEMLRMLASRIATFHFAPTSQALENLVAEGIKRDRILVTGNTVVDALLFASERVDKKKVLSELSEYHPYIGDRLNSRKLILITSHRRENIGAPLKKICRAIKQLADKYRNAFFLWSLHKNPEVRQIVLSELTEKPENLMLTESFSYQTMVYLLRKAYIIMTDSGGVQEEASTFHKPLIILRETTERPEVVENGIGFLVGSDEKKIIKKFSSIYEDNKLYDNIAHTTNPFGDGKASERIHRFFMLDEIKRFIENFPSSSEETLNIGGKIDV